MKTTVCIQIGNSDDRLSQLEWCEFVKETGKQIDRRADIIYFTGFSVPSAPWQNACWVFDIDSQESRLLWDNMNSLRDKFRQNSIAWTEGITVFITS